MKHGDREKGKTAKAASQASGKSGKTVTVLKGGKAAGENGKSSGAKKAAAESGGAKAAGEKGGSRLAVSKSEPLEKGDGGKVRRAAGGESGGFNNPIVASAFKRAVAKYPNAFRKLTD